jgi:hypothetical protein
MTRGKLIFLPMYPNLELLIFTKWKNWTFLPNCMMHLKPNNIVNSDPWKDISRYPYKAVMSLYAQSQISVHDLFEKWMFCGTKYCFQLKKEFVSICAKSLWKSESDFIIKSGNDGIECIYLSFFFLVIFRIELRALSLLDKHCIVWATRQPLVIYFFYLKIYNYSCFVICFFFCGTRDWTQGLELANQCSTIWATPPALLGPSLFFR